MVLDKCVMICTYHFAIWASQVAQRIKNSPPGQETQGWMKMQEDPTDKSGHHSSILAWRIPWIEELGGSSPWGSKGSDVTEWLSAWECEHTHTHRIAYYSKIICAPTIYSFCSITLDNYWSFYFIILLFHNVRYLELYSIQPWEAERLVICISSSSMFFLGLAFLLSSKIALFGLDVP